MRYSLQALIPFVALLCGCASQLPSHRPYTSVPITHTLQRTCRIRADGGWQDSTVVLAAGDNYFVDAKGRWSGGIGWACGPSGSVGWDVGRIFPEERAATALIGRVGNGAPFTIGDQHLGVATYPGNLFMRMNDPTTGDNSGALTVDIYVAKAEASSGAFDRRTANSLAPLPSRAFPRRNIAVAGLESSAVSAAEAGTLSESLRAVIVESDYFTVVSRADMKRILEEQKFQRSDLSDTQCLVEMGKILAVEKIIGGSVGRVGDTFSLSVRMVDVESAQIDALLVQDVKGREDALLSAIRTLGKSMCLKYAESRTTP